MPIIAPSGQRLEAELIALSDQRQPHDHQAPTDQACTQCQDRDHERLLDDDMPESDYRSMHHPDRSRAER